MTSMSKVGTKAAATYNAAVDLFDHPANAFWERSGRHTIRPLDPKAGALVLDVCCGSGASALPAAEAVRDTGYVIGIDRAERLIDLARIKPRNGNLNNIEFRIGGRLDTGFDDAHFDAVVCVFGIFFVPYVSAAVRELWRVLRGESSR